MTEYQTKRLGEFIELKRGYDLPARARTAGEFSLVSSSGPSDTHNEAKVRGPGVVTGRYGTIGQVFFIKDDFWPLNTTLYVRDFKGNHPQFTYYFLQTLDWQKFNDKSGVPGVNRNDAHHEPIRVPPLCEQKAIAEVLGSLDDKIELNRRMNETLEAMAQAIFRDWFVEFGPTRRKIDGATDAIEIMGGLVSDPDRARELAKLFPAKMGDNGLPEGWIETPASALIEFNPKEPMKRGVFAPYTDMASLPTSGSIADIPIFREFGSGMRFRNGDALLARITPCLENGKTALVDFLKDEATVGWGSTEFIVMRAKSPIPMPFSYLLARDNDFRDTAIRNMSGTSGRQRVQAESLENYRIACPNDQVFVVFDHLVTPLFELISANGRQNRTIAATRDLLLPKLMSGEIRLRDAERAIEAVA